MFDPIKRKTKLLGDPWCSSHTGPGYWNTKADPAWWINKIVDDLAWVTGFTRFYNWAEARLSWKINGRFVCPEHAAMGDRFNVFGNKHDWWRWTGKDRTCSYCGSCHPEDFEKFLKRVVDDPDIHVTVSMADGCHKVYLNRPGVINASCGAIKFYGYHAPRDEKGQVTQAHYDLLKPALQVSREKFNKQTQQYWDRMKKEAGE